MLGSSAPLHSTHTAHLICMSLHLGIPSSFPHPLISLVVFHLCTLSLFHISLLLYSLDLFLSLCILVFSCTNTLSIILASGLSCFTQFISYLLLTRSCVIVDEDYTITIRHGDQNAHAVLSQILHCFLRIDLVFHA